jgi:glucose dehydrogenase
LLPSLYSASASSLQTTGNWVGPENNYPLNWNYNAQNIINQSNVQSLQVDWTFPVPEAPTPYQGAEGAMITPLVVDGIIYTITNWHRVLAINAENGAIVWFQDLPLTQNYSSYLQPSVPAGVGYNTGTLGHYHSMLFTTKIRNESLVWVVSNTYQVFALNALTGDIVISFQPFPQNLTSIQGNHGIYDQDTPMILIDQSRGVLIFGPSVSEGTSDGRGFIEGFNLTSTVPKVMWQTFIMPPQDGSDPGWSLSSVENSTNAYIFNGTSAIDLKTLPAAQLRSLLYGDWGTMGYNGTRSYAGMSAGWGGSWAIDENTGTAYIGTAQASPDWNATNRPGPNLWSDSILAINETTGRLVWGFQSQAHSLGDFDCSWNVILANVTITSKNTEVVYKGCKNGYLFALNAQNGSMIWYLRPQSIVWDSVSVLNPLNKTAMTEYNWAGYPSTSTIVLNPSDTGSLESDISYDPALNLVYLAPYNAPKKFLITDVGPGASSVFNWEFDWGTNFASLVPAGPTNTTIYAVDANNGTVRWSYFILNEPYRGGMTVSGGVVYVSTLNGMLTMLDAQTGRLLSQKNIGGELLIQPSIASDANGKMEVVLTDMGSARWGPTFPGFIQALSISPESQSTITVNSSTPTVQGTGVSLTEFYGVLIVIVILLATVVFLAFELRKARK